MRLEMKTTVRVEDLLKVLKRSREQHVVIVKEAREGYLRKAEEAVRAKLDEIRSGKKIVTLVFALTVPVDYTEVYNTAIGLLEMSTQATIELSSADYRHLVEDKWDWSSHFLMSNSAYSVGAARRVNELGDSDE